MRKMAGIDLRIPAFFSVKAINQGGISMQQTGNSRIMLLAFIFLLVSLYSFCEEERLDLDKKVTVTLSKFVKKEEGWYTTGDQMVPVSDTDPASIELQFPAEWNIVKFIIYAGKVRYSNGIDGTKNVSSMYNFECRSVIFFIKKSA